MGLSVGMHTVMKLCTLWPFVATTCPGFAPMVIAVSFPILWFPMHSVLYVLSHCLLETLLSAQNRKKEAAMAFQRVKVQHGLQFL
jgi:hypothetical protein